MARIWRQVPIDENAEAPARVSRRRKKGWTVIKGTDPGSSPQRRLQADLRKAADSSRRPMKETPASRKVRRFLREHGEEPSVTRLDTGKVTKGTKAKSAGGAFGVGGSGGCLVMEVAKGGDTKTEKFIGGNVTRLFDNDEAA